MTEQERLLEATRAQIRQHVGEIAELARTVSDPAGFFPEFLHRVVASLNGQGGAVWGLDGAGGFAPVADLSFATCGYVEGGRQARDIGRVLGEVVRTRRPCIVNPAASAEDAAPGEDQTILNRTAHPFFFVPILVGDGEHAPVGAVLHVWLQVAGDPKTYPTLVTFLNQVCAHAAGFLRARRGEAAVVKNAEYEALLRFQGDLIGELDPAKVGRAAVHHAIDLLGASRVGLLQKVRGRWTLQHVSHQDAIDARSVLVRALGDVAARLPAATGTPATLTLDDPATAAGWQTAFDAIGARHLAWTHFRPHPHAGPADGLLLAERHSGAPFGPNGLRLLGWTRTQTARALETAETHHGVPLRRVLRPVVLAKGMWRQRRRVRLAAFAAVPALALAAWLLVPWPLRLEGDCSVQPARLATVAAETSGKVEEVFVHEGDVVRKGALLGRMEDQDVRTQIAVNVEELNKWQAEGFRFQSAGDDAQRKLAEINAQRARATLERLRYLQTRAELRAPIAGVVLTKNLGNRVGEALETGRPFCELAARDAYELQIDLRQQDLGVVLDSFRRQPRHALPVTFILHARTAATLRTELAGPAAISEAAHAKPGGNYFTARAEFPLDPELAAALRPGYTGKAKIDLGRRSLAAVMMRKFLDYWRVEWAL